MRQDIENLIVTPAEMARIDAAAAASGISSFGLMVNAGQAVAAAALKHFPQARRFAILCGPGNNGGDGYIAATALFDSGATVAVFSSIDPSGLHGDAALAWKRCGLTVRPLADFNPEPGDVVVDALFGAGLSRDLPPEVLSVIAAVAERHIPVVSVDLPSGVSGLSGAVLGAAFRAARTVTFMCRKPGHLLMPGRALCGTLDVVDIGIPARIVVAQAGPIRENGPSVWMPALPATDLATHKYKRGHLAVFSGKANATGPRVWQPLPV